MDSLSHYRQTSTPRHRQSGLALMVALIALAAMTLAGVALVRSIDTNALIAGNLAFRQNATTSGDAGVEAARTWLLSKTSANLQGNDPANGYYASRMDTGGLDGKGIDITGSRTKDTGDNVKWIDASGDQLAGAHIANCAVANDVIGNRMCYVIHRMCAAPGALGDIASDCSLTTSKSSTGNSMGSAQQLGGYQKLLTGSGTIMGYYRISVRVAGPRNNNSYVQVFVQR